jgi:two-component system LytT family response regulator
LRVRTRQGHERIAFEDVEFIDAHGNYARLVSPQGRHLVRRTMAQLERELGDAFVRVHRSAIVRRDRVVKVERAPNGRTWIHLASGQRVASGRSYRNVVRDLGL